MPLQSSGLIRMSQIRTELLAVAEINSVNYGLRGLSSAANKSAPDAMSEFYGYSASGGGGGPTCNSAGFCYRSTNCDDACYPTGFCPDQTYFWVGILGVGSVLYTSCASGPATAGYYSSGGTCYTVGSGGVVTAANACPTCYSGTFQFGYSATNARCGPFDSTILYWLNSLQNGTYVKTGGCSGLSIAAEEGYYWGPTGGLSVPQMWYISGNVVSGPQIEPACFAPTCYTYQVTNKGGFFNWIDCCGTEQGDQLGGGDTFCAQAGTVVSETGSFEQVEGCNCP